MGPPCRSERGTIYQLGTINVVTGRYHGLSPKSDPALIEITTNQIPGVTAGGLLMTDSPSGDSGVEARIAGAKTRTRLVVNFLAVDFGRAGDFLVASDASSAFNALSIFLATFAARLAALNFCLAGLN